MASFFLVRRLPLPTGSLPCVELVPASAPDSFVLSSGGWTTVVAVFFCIGLSDIADLGGEVDLDLARTGVCETGISTQDDDDAGCIGPSDLRASGWRLGCLEDEGRQMDTGAVKEGIPSVANPE